MKTTFKSTARSFALAALLVGFAGTASAKIQTMASPDTKEIAIGLNDVFVPGGFDSEADAYVVASGLFPNGCYSWKGASVKNVDAFNHEVQSFATVSQGLCIMVLVPFNKEIRLGKLSTGTHNLKFLNGDGTFMQKTMTIE